MLYSHELIKLWVPSDRIHIDSVSLSLLQPLILIRIKTKCDGSKKTLSFLAERKLVLRLEGLKESGAKYFQPFS